MTDPTRPTGARRPWLRGIFAGVAVAVAIGMFLPGPANADPRDRHDHDHYRHDQHYRHVYRRPAPVYGYGAPTYVPAPPPVVYSPVGPPAALNFIFPLNFR